MANPRGVIPDALNDKEAKKKRMPTASKEVVSTGINAQNGSAILKRWS